MDIVGNWGESTLFNIGEIGKSTTEGTKEL